MLYRNSGLFVYIFVVFNLFFLYFPTQSYSFDPENVADCVNVYKKLLSANKLPLLDSEKEEEIIEKSNEIFKTKKSWYLSSKYLYEEVTNPDQGYPVYGNQKIKDKLIQLLKMKIQCRLKELLYKEEKREQIKVSL
ncbi:MAG TPA: hypothetical protein PLA12_09120, partial [Candidatus Hydrogenedens sp.]|nr:hypothetical protein [Candidatus Hydrogenedens sp.]